jgi:uncharacterized protein (TIGR02300 family)
VAKPELGTKRICPNCGTRYYDLNRDPIVCPRCGTYFEATTARARPAAVVDDEEEDIELEADAKAVFVPLEEADQEEADTGAVVVEDDVDEVDADDDADDTFLEPDEDEEGDDVTTIIGDVDDEET